MSQESPSQPLPPDPIDAESLARLLDNEYFRLKMEHEVRLRTQVELAAWWKRLISITAVIVTIIGVVGVKEYIALNQLRTDAQNQIKEDGAALKEKTGEIGDLIEGSKVELEQMRAANASTAEALKVNNQRVTEFLTDAADRSAALSAQYGSLTAQVAAAQKNLDRSVENIEESRKEVVGKVAEVDTFLKDGGLALDRLKAETGKREAEHQKLLDAQWEYFRAAELAREQTVNEINKQVNDVRQKLYGGGSFVLKEKASNQIRLDQSNAGGPGCTLVVRIAKISSQKLQGVTILVVQDDEEKPLVPSFDLSIGRSRKFDAPGYKFTLTPRYILEQLFRSDQVGIDLKWEIVAPSGDAGGAVARTGT